MLEGEAVEVEEQAVGGKEKDKLTAAGNRRKTRIKKEGPLLQRWRGGRVPRAVPGALWAKLLLGHIYVGLLRRMACCYLLYSVLSKPSC